MRDTGLGGEQAVEGRKSAAYSAFKHVSPSPDLRHAVAMPDYRRNRIPGATYFFTVNLLERGCDLLGRSHRCATRRGAQGAHTISVPSRRVGRLAGPHALPVDPSQGRLGFSPPLARYQDGLLEIPARERETLPNHHPPGRTRDLAAPILGAYDSRRSRLYCPP